MKQPWYRFQAQADPAVADLHILDMIASSDPWGDGACTPKQFLTDLSALPAAVATIRVHINCRGGDTFAAMTITNALRDQGSVKGRTVETIVEGLAASAATLVMMAGSKITVADNALVVVHNPWSIVIGNAIELRKTADSLDSVRGTMLATYQWHSHLSDDELIALLDAETWMDADEAIANGFATDKVEGLRAAACLDPAALTQLHVPERFQARLAELIVPPEPAPKPEPVADAAATLIDVFPLVRAAGLDMEFAAQLVESATPKADVQARVTVEKEKRAAEATRNADIRALVAKAKLGGDRGEKAAGAIADDLIAGGMSFDAARSLVGKTKALLDAVEIDAGLKPDQGKPPAGINTGAIYAERNNKRSAN